MNIKATILSLTLFFCASVTVNVQSQSIPSPKEFFGFNIGDDYMLTNYTKAEAYYKKVAEISDRVVMRPLGEGKTEEGRDHHLIIISSPQNLQNLDRYQEISQRLARAEGLTDSEAQKLAEEGKAVVWIDGGLHATETLGSHQLIETLYQLAGRNDAETRRILDNVIVLLVHANPDGQELVADWYMKESDPAKRNMSIPRLYQKYIGHDNNRDFYMNNMKESQNMSRIMYVDWLPQIMYNHHQSAPAGAIVAGPPFTDPFSYFFDPLLVTGIDEVGSAMISRLNKEGKPGYTRMKGSVFSVWYNGGLRTTTYFHNIVGLLTETWGNPTPSQVPLVPDRLQPTANTPNPIRPQEVWHFKQSIDYSVSMNYAVLDYAARNSDRLLYNIYQMGKNSVERGSRDYWTLTPKLVNEVKSRVEKDRRSTQAGGGFMGSSADPEHFDAVYRIPENRDPRGFIIPADQNDAYTVNVFINTFIRSGIKVEKATSNFTVEGKTYPKDSYVIRTNQAFRPYVLDMFEPQDYPNDFAYPGGPPILPYDQAGWTLAYQMGIKFDRILDGFDGPFAAIPYGELQSPAPATVAAFSDGYILKPGSKNSFLAVNELLKNKIEVRKLNNKAGNFEKGSFYVPGSGRSVLQSIASKYGLDVAAAPRGAAQSATKISASRVALYDRYGGSMPSGWTRWLLEQFNFPFTVIYPQDIDNGNLNSKYDVILFMDTPIATSAGRFFRQPDAADVLAEYRNRLGDFSAEKSLPQLLDFMNKGGRVVTTGQSSSLAYELNLPVRNALTVEKEDGQTRGLTPNEFFIPGSLLEIIADKELPENSGINEKAVTMFSRSNVFRLNPEAFDRGMKPLAWFGNGDPLKSGWAWGSSWLHDGVMAFSAPVGNGKFYAYSTQIIFRGQSYNTFPMLFNHLYKAN